MTDDKTLPKELVDALAGFDAKAGAIVAKFSKGAEEEEPPSKLYHYTNDVGLRGILESGQFWVTDIFNLNDPSELKHSLSLAHKILAGTAKNKPQEIFAKEFEIFATRGGLQASADYFVTSFSANGDDLGQWRAYADDGRGYVLEFDTKSLEAAFIANPEGVSGSATVKITYSDVTMNALFKQIVDLALPLIVLPAGKNYGGPIISHYMTELSVLFTVNFIQLGLFFKHPAYSNEQEYRFLQVHSVTKPPRVKYRARPHSLVRYREFDWRTKAATALTKITIGPAAARDLSIAYVEDCLRAYHVGPVEIDVSRIPYRSGR